MFDKEGARARLKAIEAEMDAAVNDPSLTGAQLKQLVDRGIAESEDLGRKLKSHSRAMAFRAGSEIGEVHTKAFGAGPRWNPPSPAHATEAQIKSLWLAAKNKLPSFGFELGQDAAPSWDAGDMTVRTKATVAEGPPNTLLAPTMMPAETLRLPYEPDRIFEHFIGAQAHSQSVQYLQHTGNVQPATTTAELGTKLDVGMQWAPRMVSFQKISALASVSTEALDDYNVFYQFTTNDLTRACVDAETNYIVNQAVTGLIWQAEPGIANPVLTRQVGADTPLNALRKAVTDIRVGSAFGTADKMAMHPRTADYLARQVDTLGRYLLQSDTETAQTGRVSSIWNCDVIQNTWVPMNYVIVWDSSQAIMGWTRQALTVAMNPWGDTEWSQNFISFRAEERIAVGIPRPTAVCLVSGFPGAGS